MIIEILHVLATLMIGLYAGSLLTEAAILVPYWRQMDPAEFFKLHGTLGPKLFKYFAPLTSLTVGISVIAAIYGNPWKITAAGLCCTALVIFFLYFKKANASFAAHSLKEKDLAAELNRWSNWHWLRTWIIIGALASSVIGQA